MKIHLVFACSLCLVLSPCLVMASEISITEEIAAMTAKMEASTQLYAKCWQTCADSDYGKLNCTTTCDEDGYSQSSGGGGGGSNIFSSPEGIILGTVLLVGIVALVWYMADQSYKEAGI